MKRRQHLLSKKDRNPEGRCQTSLWGPYCPICQEKGYKELSKKLKPALDKLAKMTDEEKKIWAAKVKKSFEERQPNPNMLKFPKPLGLY